MARLIGALLMLAGLLQSAASPAESRAHGLTNSVGGAYDAWYRSGSSATLQDATAEATALPTQPVAPVALPSPTPGDDGVIVYRVVAGDTLSGIAVQFGLTVDELLVMNNLQPDSLLLVGQEIVLGYSQSATRAAAVPRVPEGTTLREDGSYVYIVVAGDSLLAIAAAYDLRLAELLALNEGLPADSLLTVGQEIVVGQRPQPASVGGSTDMRTGLASATPPPATPTSPPQATPTQSPTLTPQPTAGLLAGATRVAYQPLATLAAPAGTTTGAAIAPGTLYTSVVVVLVAAGLLVFLLGRRR
ncbi:MAG: LysM peptidoglycan-binding domain-containing protein [Anaerolineae bacterium]|nr:LysM peptidoglycan-binding domain-containing protein [Anaerolineae bacterium]